jgi:hypothetical protein
MSMMCDVTMKSFCLIFLGLTAASHAAAEVSSPQAVKALISELQEADFTNITATERLLGGVVVEAQQNDGAVLITLAPVTYTVSYVEVFSEASDTGFFGTAQRPVGAQIENLLARYQLQLENLGDAGGIPDITNYVTESLSHERTAGFSQNKSLTIDEDTVIIKQSETLGLLNGFTTFTQESETTDTNSNDKTTFRYSMSTSTTTQSVQMSGVDGFSSDVFTDTQRFTQKIKENNSFQRPDSQSLRSNLIEQIATSSENSFSNTSNNQTLSPANFRSLIDQNLKNQSE